MKKQSISLLIVTVLALSGCTIGPKGGSSSESAKDSGSNPYAISSVSSGYSASQGTPVSYDSVSNSALSVKTSYDVVDYGDFSFTTDDGAFTEADGVYTITKAGTYNAIGTLEEGRIIVEAGDDDEVTLNLNNATIQSAVNSPIMCTNADSFKIKSVKGSTNYVLDARAAKTTDDDTQGNGAIYSKCDTSLSGKGELSVAATYNNGIHSTKDLKIKSSTITVNALNNALKGNDSVTIESGNIVAISTGGDGIKTEDSDVSSKGNQRGTVTISGGQVDIYSCADGIDASYDVDIHNGTDEDTGETTIPVVNIYTSNYSEYSGDHVEDATSTMYLRTTSAYSSSYRYALYCKDTAGAYTWADATYATSQKSGGGPGGGSTYYFYSLTLPSNTSSFKIYEFRSSAEDSLDDYVSCMKDFKAVNSSYDTLNMTISGTTITAGSWTTYSTSQNQGGPGGWGGWGGSDGGNSDKADYSAKGIKANNKVMISGGVTEIKAYDDGIHANYYQDNVLLDNGEKGVGDVVIYDGKVTVYAADDGIHADRYLTINGGEISITHAYEGLEGDAVTIAGGSTSVVASDDGVNAANKAGITPYVQVDGGFLDVTVNPSGDTDGIDSNGNYVQNGGVVVTKGPNSQAMAALDWGEGYSATVNGGTLIVFGNTGGTVKTSGSVTKKSGSSTSHSGTVKVTVGEDEYTASCGSYRYTGEYIWSDSTVTLG